MKCFAQTCLLKDDQEIIKKYEKYHSNVWPEVVEGSYKCGVRRTFLYRRGRQLFMFMETVDNFDMERDMPKYMEDPKAREWDELMRTYQTNFPDEPEGSTWVPMKEICVLDKS